MVDVGGEQKPSIRVVIPKKPSGPASDIVDDDIPY
jgi:hypothetical protein